MKKIISLIVISVMLLSALVMNVGAADEAFTKEAAEALLIEGYQRWTLIQERVITDNGKYLKEDEIKVDSKLQTLTEFNVKGDGSAYKRADIAEILDYVPVTDERFDTMDKCYAYLEQVFTVDMSKSVVERNAYIMGDYVESIRLSNGGKLFSPSKNVYEDWEDGKVMILYAHKPSDPIHTLDSIGEFTVSGDTAKLTVTALSRELHSYNDAPENAIDVFPGAEQNFKESVFLVPYEEEVTFVKTAEGWRISGGSFFERHALGENSLTVGMKKYLGLIPSPNTGDETAIFIALLALSGIAIAVVPAMKKRRIR